MRPLSFNSGRSVAVGERYKDKSGFNEAAVV